MSEKKAFNVGPSGVDIAYESFGDPSAPPVLLIMGVGGQMIGWLEGFCAELAEHGLWVTRFDNRDVGLSTHVSDAPVPDLPAALAGDTSTATYTLSDMAADAVGLLDVLGVDRAHLVGASMGGMIAQTVAIEFPQRVRSLTSMMSTTGDRCVGQMSPQGLNTMRGPAPTNRDEVIEQRVRAMRVAGSPGYEIDEAQVRERAGLAYDRSHDPLGIARQAIAVVASGDRTPRLKALDVPTLVLHGADDRMCDVSGGQATAAAIPDAELVIIDGWGHNIPQGLWPELTSRIAAHVHRN